MKDIRQARGEARREEGAADAAPAPTGRRAPDLERSRHALALAAAAIEMSLANQVFEDAERRQLAELVRRLALSTADLLELIHHIHGLTNLFLQSPAEPRPPRDLIADICLMCTLALDEAHAVAA